jgi:Laminin G domain
MAVSPCPLLKRVDDPNENHLSVQGRGGWAHNSADPQFSLGHTTGIPFLADGQWHTVELVYTPGTLIVSFDGTQVFTVAVDLADWMILEADGTAWVGLRRQRVTGYRSMMCESFPLRLPHSHPINSVSKTNLFDTKYSAPTINGVAE